MNIRSMTSLLKDRVLFELDIQRTDNLKALKILPLEARLLQDQSMVKDPVEAKLINHIPLQVQNYSKKSGKGGGRERRK